MGVGGGRGGGTTGELCVVEVGKEAQEVETGDGGYEDREEVWVSDRGRDHVGQRTEQGEEREHLHTCVCVCLTFMFMTVA